MFKNIPWKAWTTRKVTLMFSIFMVIAYIVTDVILTIRGTPLSDTLTEHVFIYFTALPVSGCAITIAKVIKGKSNTDKDEILLESEIEEEIDLKREEANENVKEIESEEEIEDELEEVEDEDSILENIIKQKEVRGKRI